MSRPAPARARRLLFGFALLFVLAVGAGLFLPRSFEVERIVVIAAPPAAIHPHVEDLHAWARWSAWNPAGSPDFETTFSGPERGADASMQWHGAHNSGWITLTASDVQKGVWYDQSFGAGRMSAKGAIRYLPGVDGTRVVWTTRGDLGRNPVNRYFGLLMDRLAGPELEQGLAGLKRLAEARPSDAP